MTGFNFVSGSTISLYWFLSYAYSITHLLSLPQYSVEGPSEEEDTLDYGILSESDSSSKTFTMHNLNPVEVSCTYIVATRCSDAQLQSL